MKSSSTNKILVIGYGNTVRGDDSAGVRAAELIAQHLSGIECITVHQLMPDQAEQIAECDVVFFLDAHSGIRHLRKRLIEPGNRTGRPRTHFMSPDALVNLSRELYGRQPAKAYVIGIPAEKFEFSESLSKSAEIAVDECVQLVEKMIADFSRDG
jgi:hydrogenase maturation protease